VWWHAPAIPATQEAEAGGSQFPGQPEQLSTSSYQN
jgi:hypothetical protein